MQVLFFGSSTADMAKSKRGWIWAKLVKASAVGCWPDSDGYVIAKEFLQFNTSFASSTQLLSHCSHAEIDLCSSPWTSELSQFSNCPLAWHLIKFLIWNNHNTPAVNKTWNTATCGHFILTLTPFPHTYQGLPEGSRISLFSALPPTYPLHTNAQAFTHILQTSSLPLPLPPLNDVFYFCTFNNFLSIKNSHWLKYWYDWIQSSRATTRLFKKAFCPNKAWKGKFRAAALLAMQLHYSSS